MFCKFKIYDSEKRHSYQIYVFNTKEEMTRHFKENTDYKYNEDIENMLAFVHTSYNILKSGNISKNIGEVYFNKEVLNYGMIAHEMMHCAMDFDREINKNTKAIYGDGYTDREDEERLAYLLQSFTEECLSLMIKKKVF